MPLVSLAYTAAERAEEAREYSTPEVPSYPWGLQVRLEEEELSKLGLLDPLPEVGGELHLEVIAKVTGVNQTQMADGSSETCVTLQITMAGVALQESAADERGEVETPAREASETRRIPSLLRASGGNDN